VLSGATLGTHPRGRLLSPRSRERYVELATHPLRPRLGGRVIRDKGFSPTYPPPQGPRLAGPRAVCHRLWQPKGKDPGLVSFVPPPITPTGGVRRDTRTRKSIARARPGARERPRVGAHRTVTAERCSGVPGLP